MDIDWSGTCGRAVHDMVILFASVRHNGLSLIEIAKKEIGTFSSILTAIAVILIIITALAGLSLVVVNALFNSPWGIFTVGATIPIAILMGAYMKWFRPGKVLEATIIGVVLLILSVVVGPYIQHSSLASVLTFSKKEMTVIIASYGFIAAVLPVWILLVSRDYLSTYMKLGVMILLAIGVIIVNPTLKMPAVT